MVDDRKMNRCHHVLVMYGAYITEKKDLIYLRHRFWGLVQDLVAMAELNPKARYAVRKLLRDFWFSALESRRPPLYKYGKASILCTNHWTAALYLFSIDGAHNSHDLYSIFSFEPKGSLHHQVPKIFRWIGMEKLEIFSLTTRSIFPGSEGTNASLNQSNG